MNKLVIADDEKKVRNRVISIIESAHIPISEIIECDNGEKALDIIKNEEIDVLITDVNMPQLDGIMLAREIKKLGCNTKIIVISWYNDFNYAVNLLRSGVREYLLKPINKDDIEKTRKDIYYLSEQRANLISNIIEAIETSNKIDGINAEERKKAIRVC